MSVSERNCKESFSSLQGIQTQLSTNGQNACLREGKWRGKNYRKALKQLCFTEIRFL